MPLPTALDAANVPATVGGGNRQSFRLTGQAAIHPADGGREEIMIDWRLTDRGGSARGEIAQRNPALDGSWRMAGREVMQGIATAAASRIADLIQDDTGPFEVSDRSDNVVMRITRASCFTLALYLRHGLLKSFDRLGSALSC